MTIVNGYCTLAGLKAYAIPDAAADAIDDAVLEGMIEAASRYIDGVTGRKFYPTTETRYFNVPEDGELWLDEDLLSITTLTNGDGTTLTPAMYKLLPLNGTPKYAIHLLPGNYWTEDADGNDYGVISVAGSWGYAATAPESVHEACLLQAARLFKRRDAPLGVAGSNELGQVVAITKLDPDVIALIDYFRKVL